MSLLLDLRWAWRGLARQRGVAAVALLTLGVGLGINTAVFSLVDAVLLRSRPLRDPARLAVLWTVWKREGQSRNKLSEPEYLDFAGQAKLLSGVEVFTASSANLTGEGEPEQVRVGTATAGLLPLLGVPPLAGRTFRREEELPGSPAVVVLSEELWRRRFGADPRVVGRSLRLDGEGAEVIGVAPSWFELPGKIDLWQPLTLDRAKPTPRGAHFLTGIARLAPGARWSQAQAEVASIAGALRQRYPEFYPPSLGWGARLAPLLAEQSADLRPALLLLAAAAALVLLVACVNVANLRLASLRHQVKELAVRVAFGASRWQVARQLLAESLLVALGGGALGLLLGGWALRLLPSVLPAAAPRLAEASLDLPVLAFTLAATLLAAAIAGLVPAVQVARIGPHAALKDAGARTTEGAASRRLHRWLVGGETAMAVLLLIGAGLVLENLVRLEQVSPGFDPHRVLTASVALPNAKYPTPAAVAGFYEQVLARLGGLPGVEAAGAVSLLPLCGKEYSGDWSVEGAAADDALSSNEASRRAISQDYFRAMRIPLLAGRAFTVHDGAAAPGVVIVDGGLAQRFWPRGGAVGRRLKLGRSGESSPWLTVVGVVGHVKHDGLDSQSRGQMYFPVAQFPRLEMTLVLRTREGDPLAVAPGVAREVQALDPAQPIANLRTMEDWLARSLLKQRLLTALLLLAAVLAAALAMVGLYAALASSTAERRHEIGIRMAVGANRGDILRMLVRQGAALAARGIAVGMLTAVAAAPALAGQLSGLSPYDPVAYLAAAAALALVAMLASLLPARRATRVEPVETLRVE